MVVGDSVGKINVRDLVQPDILVDCQRLVKPEWPIHEWQNCERCHNRYGGRHCKAQNLFLIFQFIFPHKDLESLRLQSSL